jgi:nucleoside 2-deoxyribosyltransferase
MKIYVANNFSSRNFLNTFVFPLLRQYGHEITSRWATDADHEREGELNEALKDLEDIQRSDAILLFTDNFGDRPGRGKYVELGYALALNKTIFVFGQVQDMVFYSLPNINRINSISGITNGGK